LAIAGQVMNAQTQAAIARAKVVITRAPAAFTQCLVTHALLIELPRKTKAESPELGQARAAQAQLRNPSTPHIQKLTAAQVVLDYLQRHQGLSLSRWDCTCSSGDGHFQFLDLPQGDYQLKASLDGRSRRYASAEVTTTVPREEAGQIKPAIATIALPATTLKGRITDRDDQQPVTLAEVRIKETGEITFTDLEGHYSLVGLEAAAKDAVEKLPYTVFVKAQGYKSPQSPPTVVLEEPGIVIDHFDFALEKLAIHH
jgi:hypothetical protein